MDAAVFPVIFDAVFHEIEQDLIRIVLKGQNRAALFHTGRQLDRLPVGQRHKHTEHARERLPDVDDLVLTALCLVSRGPAEREQLLRHARQPVGLCADVGDEFPHRVCVHLVLQDGVGQQLDRRQRRFELVRGVGDELPFGDLCLLQLVGQLVELRRQRRVLVRAAHLNFVAVFALAHKAHGGHDPPHTARTGHGKHDRAQKDDPDQHQRAAEDRALETCDDAALRGVVFHQIHAPHDGIMQQNRRGSVALERAVFIDAVKKVAAAQRLHDRLKQDEFALGILAGDGIIERAARRVGHDQARDVHIADDGDDLLRRFLRQRVHAGERGRDDLQLILRGRAFCLEHQIARGGGGINIQKHEHEDRNGHIRQRVADLRA